MQKLPKRLKLLDRIMANLPFESDAMLVSEHDGILADILVCPALIMPGEWLPLVWGSDEDDAPVFQKTRRAERLIGLVM